MAAFSANIVDGRTPNLCYGMRHYVVTADRLVFTKVQHSDVDKLRIADAKFRKFEKTASVLFKFLNIFFVSHTKGQLRKCASLGHERPTLKAKSPKARTKPERRGRRRSRDQLIFGTIFCPSERLG